MSEHTDATEDRPDDDVDGAGTDRDEPRETEGDAEGPQPWAKALPGDPG